MAQEILSGKKNISYPLNELDFAGSFGSSLYGGAKKISGSLTRRRNKAYARAQGRVHTAAVRAAFTDAAKAASPVFVEIWHLFAAAAARSGRFFLFVYALAAQAAENAAVAGNGYYHRVLARLARFRLSRLNCAIAMGIAAIFVFSTNYYGLGLEVYINGQSAGYIESQNDFEQTVQKVEQSASEILGTPYSFDMNVSYAFSLVDRRKMLDYTQLQSQLFTGVQGIQRLYVLTVDGETVGAMQTRQELQDQLDLILKANTNEGDTQVEFLNDIEITNQYTSLNHLITTAALSQKLHSTLREQQYYTVLSGDTVQSIALEHGMAEQDLVSMNEGLSNDSLKAGDDIVVKTRLSLLSIKKTESVTYSEVIPYETEYVNDSSLYQGKSSTVTAGVNGEKAITDEVVYVNGRETDRITTNTEVLSEPVTKVVAVGTKVRPAYAPTGTYIRPVSGAIITSNYGYRGYEFHTGVDFAAAYGTSIRASDGGTVSFAGWKGNYGYFVIIDHEDGIQTCYAHCSSLLVSYGDKVAQGEVIARVGSTGRSTGSHCHFEVRVNGQHVSPWRYIS